MIKIIQGDTKTPIFVAEGNLELIEEIWFTCAYLNICKPLLKLDDNRYYVKFDSEFTKQLEVCQTTYDITVFLKGSDVSTVVYNDIIKILKKENEVNGN